jgi:hypothetical protein
MLAAGVDMECEIAEVMLEVGQYRQGAMPSAALWGSFGYPALYTIYGTT